MRLTATDNDPRAHVTRWRGKRSATIHAGCRDAFCTFPGMFPAFESRSAIAGLDETNPRGYKNVALPRIARFGVGIPRLARMTIIDRRYALWIFHVNETTRSLLNLAEREMSSRVSRSFAISQRNDRHRGKKRGDR